MDNKQLITFKLAAETLNFTKTASILNFAQSSVTAPSHPLAMKSEVFLSDIEHETLLLTETGCSYRTLLENACHSVKVYPVNKFEFGSIEAIKQCVIAGIGIAALPTMVVEQDIKLGEIVELKWDITIPPIFTHIAWHKDKWMTQPLKHFIELTQKSFREKLIQQ
ncbi:LysR family transcriptional regulator substrate-binding protein [Oceanobacillus polygoni]|uniref:DNA-binding transcriptional LysR family regulator n=1 Tax=Oceanobacillus polygoni TaxID=1235259 RepID=A0A9X1CFP0_9BACI|nr:DNA-binding transcriptional LysR family regulator [Oceanobacillus polygoni]